MMQALKDLADYAFGTDLSGYKSKLHRKIIIALGTEFARDIIAKDVRKDLCKIVFFSSATIGEIYSILSFYETHEPKNLILVAIYEILRFVMHRTDKKDNSELEQLIDETISKRRS